MKKNTMIKHYRNFTAAEGYIIGFDYKKKCYMANVEKLMPRYIAISRASTKNGGGQKLQLRLTNKIKEELIRKGAILIGEAGMFKGLEFNQGVEFERYVDNMYGVEFRGKDSTPFYKAGDLTINGKEIQVKFGNAQVVAEKTLYRLSRGLVSA